MSSDLVDKIKSKSNIFKESIQYKGCPTLLRNILILLNFTNSENLNNPFAEFGESYDFSNLELPKFKKGIPFKPFNENYWSDDFDDFIRHYEIFKAQQQRQSYYFYWINLINISQILVTFLHNANLLDTGILKMNDILNVNSCYDANLSQDHKKMFIEIINSFIKSLNCEYKNILDLYKKIILYDNEFCMKKTDLSLYNGIRPDENNDFLHLCTFKMPIFYKYPFNFFVLFDIFFIYCSLL
jgi:hypothetical protein